MLKIVGEVRNALPHIFLSFPLTRKNDELIYHEDCHLLCDYFILRLFWM